jgi:hypothetical protein
MPTLFEQVNGDLLDSLAWAATNPRGIVFYGDSSDAFDGMIDLRKITGVCAVEKAGRAHAFRVDYGARQLVLSAASDEDRQAWIEALLAESEASKKCTTDRFAYSDARKALVDSEEFSALRNGFRVSFSKKKPVAKQEVIVTESVGDADDSTAIDSGIVAETQAVEETVAEAIKVAVTTEAVKVEAPTEVEPTATEVEAVNADAESIADGDVAAPFCSRIGYVSTILFDINASFCKKQVTFQVASDVIKEGWLKKQSRFVKMWNARLFVLSGTADGVQLAYFKPSRAQEFAHMVIDASTVVEPISDVRFKVTSGESEFVIMADSAADRDAWMSVLEECKA